LAEVCVARYKSAAAFNEGKMGKYASVVALLVGLTNLAFARDNAVMPMTR
jgi:hypothetical protein